MLPIHHLPQREQTLSAGSFFTFSREKIFVERECPCEVSSEKHCMSWIGLLDALASRLLALRSYFSMILFPDHLLFLVPVSYTVSTFPEQSSFPASPAILEHSVINSSPFLRSPSISRSSHNPGPFLPFLTQASTFGTALYPQNLEPNSRSRAQGSQVLPVPCPSGVESWFIGIR